MTKILKNPIFWLLLLTLPAVWKLLAPGGYEPHDFHHIADIHQMYQALASGQIPPRLGPDFYMSYGYPLFNYYYVLPFYIGAGFFALTGSLMESLKLVFALSAFVSVFGMYFLLRKFFSQAASIAGSLLYLYTPFRAVEIYVRGAIGEAFAIALLPWVLLTLATLIDKTNRKNIAITAFVLMLFFLTHNYFFILAAPLIGVFSVILIINQKERAKVLIGVAAAGFLGVLASAYWWLPAFLESKLVAATTPFVIEDHFPFVKQLIMPSWGYGSSVWGPGDEISFQIGLVNLFFIAISFLVFYRLRSQRPLYWKVSLLALVLFVCSVYLMNIRSLSIWRVIPFTNFIQFPWRLLSMTSFFSAFIAAFVVQNTKFKKLTMIAVVCVSILLTVGYFRPSKNLIRSNQEYLDHFFNNPMYSEDYLQTPIGVSMKPSSVDEKIEIPGADNFSIKKVTSIFWVVDVETQDPAEGIANVLNIPGWFVEVNGQSVETRFVEPYGKIGFSVPAGKSTVKLYWAETDLRQMADLLSLVAMLSILILYLYPKDKRATI